MTYIAFEGGEGSGKSTQARLLAERLGALLTREPGATELGSRLRALLLESGQAPIGVRAETLLMAADRAQHVIEVVGPALAAGRHVVSDRSVYSSLAYQGGGRGLGIEEVRRINEWALDGCWPDLVVLLDVDTATARGRLDRTLDRLEREDQDFHDRVRCAYREMAGDDRWLTFDAAAPIDELADRIHSAVVATLGTTGR
ncbi:MAG: dTMP kinase [Acidimicrobiales bacterium]